MIEVWKIIEEFPNYSVSNLGNVKNRKTGLILKPQDNGRGYLQLKLGPGQKYKRIHQLVIDAFLGGLPEGLEPNHKDGNKRNNTPENFEFLTHKNNVIHAYATGLKKTRKIRIIETGEEFQSIAECARFINGSVQPIYHILHNTGRAHRHRGYSFEYVD